MALTQSKGSSRFANGRGSGTKRSFGSQNLETCIPIQRTQNGSRSWGVENCLASDRRAGAINALTKAMRDLQLRLEENAPPLPTTAAELHEQFGRVLRRAIFDEVLVNGGHDVGRLLRLTAASRSGDPNVFALTGGPKDFRRVEAPQRAERFLRDDGAVIHFALVVRERPAAPLDLVAYGFEIYFPSQLPIAFVRFDLNDRRHSNDDLGLRAHLHPGNEDLQLPSPLLSPLDALNFLIYRCRPRRDTPRS